MREAIEHITVSAHEFAERAKDCRASGDHVTATRLEKLAKNLLKIAKAARLLFLA